MPGIVQPLIRLLHLTAGLGHFLSYVGLKPLEVIQALVSRQAFVFFTGKRLEDHGQILRWHPYKRLKGRLS
jgi:hypothetical protein